MATVLTEPHKRQDSVNAEAQACLGMSSRDVVNLEDLWRDIFPAVL